MIPFNYHHLYYFFVIANEGSITKACRTLRLAQPTLSTQIRQFEKYLGFELFRREGRKLIVSDKGESILSYAKAIFDLGNEMMDNINDRVKEGSIRIQIGVSNWIPKSIISRVLNQIIRNAPEAYITVIEKDFPELINDLKVHKLDLILSDVLYRSSDEEKIESRILMRNPIVFCASSDFSKKIRKVPEDLNEKRMYLPTASSQSFHALEEYFLSHNIKPKIMGEIQDVELVRRLVLSGNCIAPLNKYTVENAPTDRKLVILNPRSDTGLYESVYLITKKRKIQHPLIKYVG